MKNQLYFLFFILFLGSYAVAETEYIETSSQDDYVISLYLVHIDPNNITWVSCLDDEDDAISFSEFLNEFCFEIEVIDNEDD